MWSGREVDDAHILQKTELKYMVSGQLYARKFDRKQQIELEKSSLLR